MPPHPACVLSHRGGSHTRRTQASAAPSVGRRAAAAVSSASPRCHKPAGFVWPRQRRPGAAGAGVPAGGGPGDSTPALPAMDKDEAQLRALGYKILEPVACGNAGQSREGGHTYETQVLPGLPLLSLRVEFDPCRLCRRSRGLLPELLHGSSQFQALPPPPPLPAASGWPTAALHMLNAQLQPIGDTSLCSSIHGLSSHCPPNRPAPLAPAAATPAVCRPAAGAQQQAAVGPAAGGGCHHLGGRPLHQVHRHLLRRPPPGAAQRRRLHLQRQRLRGACGCGRV